MVGAIDRRGFASQFLARGDLIVAVNGRNVTSTAQLADVPRGAEVTIQRRGQQITGVVR